MLSGCLVHGAEHKIQLVPERCGEVFAEIVEAGADRCKLVLVAWALRVVLPRCHGRVAESADGRAGEASCVSDSNFVGDMCLHE